jgi:hypothetical protein
MKNRNCEKCGEDLVSAKRSKRVRIWVSRRRPDGQRELKYLGRSLEKVLKPYMKKHNVKGS